MLPTNVNHMDATREVGIALQVLDAVIPDGKGSYLAGPISTGKRFYEMLARYRVRDLAGLLEAVGEEAYLKDVRWPNVEDGERFANVLRERGVAYLINTGPIFVRGWHGNDYMDFCLRLLEKKVRTVYFHPEWAFSSGAVKEYFFCCERNMIVLTAEGEPISEACVRSALLSVKTHLEALGLPTTRVESHLSRLAIAR